MQRMQILSILTLILMTIVISHLHKLEESLKGCYTDHFLVGLVFSLSGISSLRLSDFSEYNRCEHLEPPSLFVLFCPTCIHLDLSFASA